MRTISRLVEYSLVWKRAPRNSCGFFLLFSQRRQLESNCRNGFSITFYSTVVFQCHIKEIDSSIFSNKKRKKNKIECYSLYVGHPNIN